MNYELALKLKEKGFPTPPLNQSPIGKGYFLRDLYYPTLEELIEACRKEFGGDKEFLLWHNWINWSAGFYKFGDVNYIDDYPSPTQSGSTESEAVANLWLALQDKK